MISFNFNGKPSVYKVLTMFKRSGNHASSFKMKWFILVMVITPAFSTIRHHRIHYLGHKENFKHLSSQENLIENIIEYMKIVNSLIHTMCVQNGVLVTEVFEKFGYLVTYNIFIEGIKDLNIHVQIQNGILITHIRQRWKTYFVDIRVLPKILKLREAVWYILDGELKVLIPYSVKFGEIPNKCEFNNIFYNVPQIKTLLDVK